MRPEPNFKVGEAVMVRARSVPHKDFCIVEKVYWDTCKGIITGTPETGWKYILSYKPNRFPFPERVLRPIPPTKGIGISAEEYLKDLKGVEV